MKAMRALSDISNEHRRRAVGLGLAALVLAMAACSGGGSSGSDSNGGSTPLIPGSGSGNPASNATTDDIQRSAADSATRGISTNVGGLQNVLNDSAAIDAGIEITQNVTGGGDPGGSPGFDGVPDVLMTDLSDGLGSLIDASLGLTGTSATTERSGDVITIDPDDTALCEEELLGMSATQDDFDRCVALVADLVVEIDAASEDTGIVRYRYLGDPVLLIGYAPMAASFELNLSGLRTVLARLEELESGSIGELPSILEGALRLTATVISDAPGAEAGTVGLSVTERLRVTDETSGTDISLAPSTLLTLQADAAAGSASFETEIGALRAAFSSGDEFGNPSLITLAMSGLTGRIDVTEAGDTLRVSNLGLQGRPLTLSVGASEVLRLVMDTFGFSLNADTGQVDIDSGMDIELQLSNAMGVIDDLGSNFSLFLGLEAPGGTSLIGLDGDASQGNGTLQVLAGGPLRIRADLMDDDTLFTDDVSILAGQCVAPDDSGAGLFMVVSCQ